MTTELAAAYALVRADLAARLEQAKARHEEARRAEFDAPKGQRRAASDKAQRIMRQMWRVVDARIVVDRILEEPEQRD